MGLTVLPPDVNACEWAYTGQARVLRVGLMQIKGLKKVFVDSILEERNQDGRFTSLQDFLGRIRGEPTQIRLLIKAGCFDSIAGDITRPGLLWRLYARYGIPHGFSMSHGRNAQERASWFSADTQKMVDGDLPCEKAVTRALSIPPPYSDSQNIQDEIDLLGFPLSRHPLELYRACRDLRHLVTASTMHEHAGKSVRMRG